MTSKERLEKVADYLEKSAAPDIADEIRKCLPDLEILYLLKQHSSIVEMYSNVAKLGEHFVCEINDKQKVEKLKGWLKNDK